ncbi:poly-gamma-glutamate synthesis protein (capsule biosynthesis protein) [Crossiella equi]|uniref:Poly-gamma-glutamate synthesis protein (Capsule biosynthesis protein) n=1 Tax=Crossiella equi TaxID=130796 RepID=A0ABS5AFF0_9PSEU|nr:CapA family protein [Crossiella equi]MBP2475056.1 poly-gamma-glutamate synthesis protein (capsule biosynthesis protein) [Crossiella equi]
MRGRLTAALAATLLLTACSGEPPPAPSGAATSSQPTSAAAPAKRGFTVAASGDVLIHPALTEQATKDGNGNRDYTKLFAGVADVIGGADLAICHLEVPIAPPGGPFTGYPSFSAPPEVVTALKETGYDTCSTASNHTLDKGADGVARTLDALDKAGLKHTGSARSATEAAKPVIYEVNGVKVGHISHTFGFNGIKLPADKPWLSNQISADAVLRAARATKAAGADVVLASLHWGVEYRHEPTAEQKQLAAKFLSDPAIDLVIGHHAHVVQPLAKVEGKWVAYGLGNHIAKHEEPRGVTEEGVIARFRFTEDGGSWTVTADYVPTLVELGPPIRLRTLKAGENAAAKRIDRIVRSAGATADVLPVGK